jgi:hypothetical protein
MGEEELQPSDYPWFTVCADPAVNPGSAEKLLGLPSDQDEDGGNFFCLQLMTLNIPLVSFATENNMTFEEVLGDIGQPLFMHNSFKCINNGQLAKASGDLKCEFPILDGGLFENFLHI